MDGWEFVTGAVELSDVIGLPAARARDKARPAPDETGKRRLAASSLCFVATGDDRGRCDVSPKGDPAGSHTATSAAELERQQLASYGSGLY